MFSSRKIFFLILGIFLVWVGYAFLYGPSSTERDASSSVALVSANEDEEIESSALMTDGVNAPTLLSKEEVARISKKFQVASSTFSEVAVSQDLLQDGRLGVKWGNNSWGIELSTGADQSFSVSYKEPWGAFSLFSEGLDIVPFRSIEGKLDGGESLFSHLQLSLFDKGQKIGTVPLAPYLLPETQDGAFRIPLDDFHSIRSSVTDVFISSDSALSGLGVLSLRFSSVDAFSQKALWASTTPGVKNNVNLPPLISGLWQPSIYRTGLKNGWSIRSEKGATIVDMMDENRSVTGAAIKMQFKEQEGKLIFTHPTGVDTKGMKYLRLGIYGGVNDHGWQQLYITLFDQQGTWLATKDMMEFSANNILRSQVWNTAILPLNAFGVEGSIGKIEIGNLAVTQEGDYLWFDDVRFLED